MESGRAHPAPPCDADQHYYEVEASFTRHLEKSFAGAAFDSYRPVAAWRRWPATESIGSFPTRRSIP